MSSRIRSAVLALSLLALSGGARAQTTECTEITSASYMITAPGVYCLKQSLTAAGIGVMIESDDVVLDLNGHTLTIGGIGVRATDRSNVTVRNGTVRGGTYGVLLGGIGASRVLVERLYVQGSESCGICVQGHGAAIRNNVVIGAGNAKIGAKAGISANSGSGLRISHNQIVDTGLGAAGQVDGIIVTDAPGAAIEHNVITNTTAAPSGGYPMGIHIYTSSSFKLPMQTTVTGNRVINMRTGIHNSAGASLFVDNAVGAAATAFSGGTMAGTTNYSF
jgi:hypothetical protein